MRIVPRAMRPRKTTRKNVWPRSWWLRNRPKDDGDERGGKRDQKIVRDGGGPEAERSIADEADQAGGQKISLQRGAKVLRRPAAQRAVNGQRRAVHAVSAAEDSGTEAGDSEPCGMIFFEVEFGLEQQRVERKERDDDAEDELDDVVVDASEKQQAERNAGERGGEEPRGARDFYLSPILRDDNGGHEDRDEHGQWRGNGHGNAKGQQRHGDERLAEA